MPALAEPVLCRRCHRPVEISRGQYDVFEHMHYVCFHYEFEHDPGDPDEECGAGGCPSASINPRPERRPGPNPPRHDHVLGAGWIWLANLRRFLELTSHYVNYDFDGSDWQAFQAGLEVLQSEASTFTYPITGRPQLAITLSRDPHGRGSTPPRRHAVASRATHSAVWSWNGNRKCRVLAHSSSLNCG